MLESARALARLSDEPETRVTLALSQYILPEDLYPWLNLVSGLLIVTVGLGVLRKRVARARHPHDHAHGDHAHADHTHHAHAGHTHADRPPDPAPAGWTMAAPRED